jgi:methylase of polypeptide subunit release factors
VRGVGNRYGRQVKLSDGLARIVRACLQDAGYTVDAVEARLGPAAHAALGRHETMPAYRVTGSGDSLDALIRLFLLQRAVSEAELGKVFPDLLPELVDAGVLTRQGSEVRAAIDIRPYRDWWIAADLTPGLDGRQAPMDPDYVLGVSPASLNLIDITVPIEAGRALDVGTGCGVQALHLSGRAEQVVGTDVNKRALVLAAFTAAMNEVEVDLRRGNLFEPVKGERFDLIVSNPPFVVAPPTSGRLAYRETGFAADAVIELLVREAPNRLTDGGWLQTLANWIHVRGQDWRERVGEWLGDRSAWAVQREVLGPEEYVELWLRDAGLAGTPEYAERYDTWLTWFDDQRVEAIGMGWVVLHNVAGPQSCEHWPCEIEQPLGPHILGRMSATETVPHDVQPLRLRTAPDVVEERRGAPGADHPETIVLRRQRGMRRVEQVDTVLAGFVGACDGELTTSQILDALAELVGTDTSGYTDDVRRLVVEGFLQVEA